MGFPITHIFKALGLLTLSDDHIDTLSKIVHAQQTPWPPSLIDFRSLNETQIFAIIVDKILCLVAETVTVEVQYAGIVAPSPQIRFARNGMGDPRVWHGFSDAFLNTNTSVHSWNCEAEMDEDSEAEESSVCEEGKWNIGEKKLYLHSKHHGDFIAVIRLQISYRSPTLFAITRTRSHFIPYG